MCLLSKTEKPYIAKEDMVVYKVTIKVWKTYYSFFRDFPYNLNASYEETEEGEIKKGEEFYHIGKGWIHSYQNTEVLSFFKCCNILKCIVPKGTLYYVGTDGDICSKRLIIVKEVRLVGQRII